MKKFTFLFITTLIIGFVFFIIIHWAFRMDLKRSLDLTIAGAIGGLGGIYLMDYFGKTKNRTQKLNKKNKTPL